MGDISQSYQTVETKAPSWYTDSMSGLASSGRTATNALVDPTTGLPTAAATAAWSPNTLQTRAFGDVSANVGNYLPGLNTAATTFGRAGATDIVGAASPYLKAGTTTSGLTAANPYLTSGTSSAADLVGNYMNPYVKDVVKNIQLANQQNIRQNLSPGLTAGAVGGGQFGSQRGANALALGISNANIGALGQQAQAMQQGYAQALAAAQQQRANQLKAGETAGTLQGQFNTANTTAGQIAGNMAGQQGQLLRDVGTAQAALANQRQTAGLADVNALATLGQQQQAIEQNRALMPLDVLNKQASLMSGAQLPMTTTTTSTASPLSTIAGLAGLAKGIFTPSVAGGQSLWDLMKPSEKAVYTKMGVTPEAYAAYVDNATATAATKGFTYNENTGLLEKGGQSYQYDEFGTPVVVTPGSTSDSGSPSGLEPYQDINGDWRNPDGTLWVG